MLKKLSYYLFLSLLSQSIWAEQYPNKTPYASADVGPASHIAMELLHHHTGLQSLHISYRGSIPVIADVIGGHADA